MVHLRNLWSTLSLVSVILLCFRTPLIIRQARTSLSELGATSSISLADLSHHNSFSLPLPCCTGHPSTVTTAPFMTEFAPISSSDPCFSWQRHRSWYLSRDLGNWFGFFIVQKRFIYICDPSFHLNKGTFPNNCLIWSGFQILPLSEKPKLLQMRSHTGII